MSTSDEKEVGRRPVLVRSKDRLSGTSTNFRLNHYYPVSGDYKVHNIQIPRTNFNVNSTNNKVYFIDADAVAYTATIISGSYTSSTLPAALVAAMELVSAQTYTVTFSSTTGKLTITPGAGTISMLFSTYSTATARYLLGFEAEDTTAAASVTSTNSVDLSYPPSVAIMINEALDTNYGPFRETGSEYSIYVPFSQAYGAYTDQSSFDIQQKIKLRTTKSLNIRLLDHDNNEIDLNGVNWEFLISPC